MAVVGREPTLGVSRAHSWFLNNPDGHTMHAEHAQQATGPQRPGNKGRLVGPKPPFKLREIWAIPIRLQIAERIRDLALFNLAIDSKLRGCDLLHLRVGDVAMRDSYRLLSTRKTRFEPLRAPC
jgi:hypothetical protein